MRIEFWVDYMCPITYLTHKNLLDAVEELKLTDYEVYYRSYIIDERVFNVLKNSEKVQKTIAKHLPNIKDYNHFDTRKIHQLAHLAKWEGLATEYTSKILEAIFINNKDLTNNEEIVKLALEVGLDEDEVKNVLKTCCYNKQIDNNKLNAKSRGIKSIPHLRINMKHNYKGFYSKDELKEELLNIIEQSKSAKTECAGEICAY